MCGTSYKLVKIWPLYALLKGIVCHLPKLTLYNKDTSSTSSPSVAINSTEVSPSPKIASVKGSYLIQHYTPFSQHYMPSLLGRSLYPMADWCRNARPRPSASILGTIQWGLITSELLVGSIEHCVKIVLQFNFSPRPVCFLYSLKGIVPKSTLQETSCM
jgi:hypothetical protein